MALLAKQELVRIIHGTGHPHSCFSFEDLRFAFLQRVHEIHPDKKNMKLRDSTASTKHHAAAFIELKEAWDRFEKTVKIPNGPDTRRGKSPSQQPGSFTMFGVGCSFSDNESERLKRIKIMDEASRGWFSAGEISNGPESNRLEDSDPCGNIPLASDDLFEMELSVPVNNDKSGSACETKRAPSLVSHLFSKSKR